MNYPLKSVKFIIFHNRIRSLRLGGLLGGGYADDGPNNGISFQEASNAIKSALIKGFKSRI